MNINISNLKFVMLALLLNACATKKELLYLQDIDNYGSTPIHYTSNTIQPNDIISVTISALVPETAIAYNKQLGLDVSSNQNSMEALKLQGYLVTLEGFITLPVLGKTQVVGKTISSLESELVNILENEGHLIGPSVSIRILNAKVTILGEVKNPGTFSFTEQFITLPQALGYAGDLTINGTRTDMLVIREIDGIRHISHVDLTSSDWMNDSRYMIKPNDIIIVNPNKAKVKTAGFIGNAGTLLSIASVLLSSIILLTR